MKVTLYAFHFSIARSLYIVSVTGVVDVSDLIPRLYLPGVPLLQLSEAGSYQHELAFFNNCIMDKQLNKQTNT